MDSDDRCLDDDEQCSPAALDVAATTITAEPALTIVEPAAIVVALTTIEAVAPALARVRKAPVSRWWEAGLWLAGLSFG